MIADALLTVLEWIIGLFMGPLYALMGPPPGWLSDAVDQAQDIWEIADSFGAWVPLAHVMTIAGGILAAYIVGAGIVAVRSILSYLTFGGGAT